MVYADKRRNLNPDANRDRCSSNLVVGACVVQPLGARRKNARQSGHIAYLGARSRATPGRAEV
jgi:hypothetical protein